MVAIKTMRVTNGSDELPPITADDVLRALSEIKKSTSLGMDLWEVMFLESMRGKALEEFVVLLNTTERAGAWPDHTWLNIIIMMGKPGGGSRHIALMMMR